MKIPSKDIDKVNQDAIDAWNSGKSSYSLVISTWSLDSKGEGVLNSGVDGYYVFVHRAHWIDACIDAAVSAGWKLGSLTPRSPQTVLDKVPIESCIVNFLRP